MARRNIKRDRKGRFAKVAGMKGSNPRSVRPAGANKTKPVRSRTAKNVRRGMIAYSAVRVGAAAAAGYSVYTASTLNERRSRSTANMQTVANSMSRGLPQIKVPKRSRRGVYNITTL